jgi:hypothetical protein
VAFNGPDSLIRAIRVFERHIIGDAVLGLIAIDGRALYREDALSLRLGRLHAPNWTL